MLLLIPLPATDEGTPKALSPALVKGSKINNGYLPRVIRRHPYPPRTLFLGEKEGWFHYSLILVLVALVLVAYLFLLFSYSFHQSFSLLCCTCTMHASFALGLAKSKNKKRIKDATVQQHRPWQHPRNPLLWKRRLLYKTFVRVLYVRPRPCVGLVIRNISL